MSAGPPQGPRTLPDRPNLRHLRDQARDLLRADAASSISDAQYRIARQYGFTSWPKLRAHVESIGAIGALGQAIDSNDVARVKHLLQEKPGLHRAPMGYGGHGPLTWVAECRVPWAPPSPTRLEMAAWLIEHGSDVHQGGDMPLMRASLRGDRIPMMELLVSYGADVNAAAGGAFPIIFAPCESLDPEALGWLLRHGASPNCADQERRFPDTALDYAIGTYVRSPKQLRACVDVLLEAGGVTKYDAPGVLDLLRGRLDRLDEDLTQDPSLLTRRHPDLDCGMSGGRRLTLQGATLLHVAAEYHEVDAARLLLERGAPVDVRAAVDDQGRGGQTPIFHAVTHADALPVVRLLVERGADLSARATIPGRYDQPDEVVTCTPLEYARLCAGGESRVVSFLQSRGGVA